jgi:hypothetical protein
LKEDNKILEGKIEVSCRLNAIALLLLNSFEFHHSQEQRKTKRFLKDLFLKQTMNKCENPTKEQLQLLEEPSSDEEAEESDRTSEASASSDEESSQEEVSIASSRKRKKR